MKMSRFLTTTTAALAGATLWASPARAGESPEDIIPQADRPSEERGKFALLGRECKAAEDGGNEATPALPALGVDDTGTPGCNAWEINVLTAGEFGTGQELASPLLDVNYGIGDNLQLTVGVPYEVSRVAGETSRRVGAADVAIKHRFYDDESRGLSFAFAPHVELAIPGTARADESSGVAVTGLPLVFATRLAETSKGSIIFAANAGYNISSEDMVEDTVSGGIGIGVPLSANLAIMVQGSTEQAVGRNAAGVRDGHFELNVGALGSINSHLMWFGSIGQDFAGPDPADSSHTCATLGLRVVAGGS